MAQPYSKNYETQWKIRWNIIQNKCNFVISTLTKTIAILTKIVNAADKRTSHP